MRGFRCCLVAGAVIMLSASSAWAAPEDIANDISNNIMSPFCPGVTLHDCPSDTATALRERIKQMIVDGKTREQVMEILVAEFGDTIRATPPPGGSGLIAWVMPAVAVVGAAAVAFKLTRRWSSSSPGPAGVPISASERSRLDRELDQLRGSL